MVDDQELVVGDGEKVPVLVCVSTRGALESGSITCPLVRGRRTCPRHQGSSGTGPEQSTLPDFLSTKGMWGGGGELGKPAPHLRSLGSSDPFSLFCFPDFSFPPENVTAAASDSHLQDRQGSSALQVQGGRGLARGLWA